MATSREVASKEARRDFNVVRAIVCAKYTRYEGYDPEFEVEETIQIAQELALDECPDEGQARRADWFLKLWAEYLWDLTRIEGTRDFDDDPKEPMPGGFGDKSKYRSISADLPASPEHVHKLKAEAETQRQRQEEQHREAASLAAKFRRQREEEEEQKREHRRQKCLAIAKTRRVGANKEEVQDLTSRIARLSVIWGPGTTGASGDQPSSPKDAASPLPPLPLSPLLSPLPSPTQSDLELSCHSHTNKEHLVANMAPRSGGVSPDWTSQADQEGDPISMVSVQGETEKLEAEAESAGFENHAHAYEAKCLGLQDALSFYKHKNWERKELEKENMAKYVADRSSETEASATGSGTASSETWADHSDEDSEVKQTWANKSGSSSKTKNSKTLVVKLTHAQEKLLEQVKDEVLTLFEDPNFEKRMGGLDRIIVSRLSSIQRVGLTTVIVADHMTDCVMEAFPFHANWKEHSDIAGWLTNSSG